MKELLGLFERHDVDYVLVGGFAVNYYGYPRTTQDINFLIFPSVDNARRFMLALEDFGFGGARVPRAAFEKSGSAIHLGVEPNRIDLLIRLEGVENEPIFEAAQQVTVTGLSVRFTSFGHLIAAKSSSQRQGDLTDADELKHIRMLGEEN